MTMPNNRRFIVTLEAPPWASDANGIRRLRAMLKRIGRGYGLRCVDVRPVEPQRAPNPDGEYSYGFTSNAKPVEHSRAEIGRLTGDDDDAIA